MHLHGRLGCFVRALGGRATPNGGLKFVTRRVKHRVGALNSGSGRDRVRVVIIGVGSRLRRVGRRILGILWGVRRSWGRGVLIGWWLGAYFYRFVCASGIYFTAELEASRTAALVSRLLSAVYSGPYAAPPI